MPSYQQIAEKYLPHRPELSPAHINLLKFYSHPLRVGPRLSDELVSLILHLYSPEEAEVAQHLKIYIAQSASQVARKAHKPVWEVENILSHLADDKHLLLSHQKENQPKKYRLVPLMPGAFEMILMNGKDDPWHRRFAQLYEALYNTGYLADLLKRPAPVARFIPVEKSIEGIPALIPDFKLTEIMENSKSFALGTCACRQARHFTGHACDLPRETCLTIGNAADYMISRNLMRRVDRSEALEIKQRANAAGLANLTINVAPGNPNFICSCCGCCCVALRTITQFNTPGLIAPPHFLPVRNPATCLQCQTCIKKCPTHAHQIKEGIWNFIQNRCIGCGICASQCPTGSIKMKPVKLQPDIPPKNYYHLGLKMGVELLPPFFKWYLSKKFQKLIKP